MGVFSFIERRKPNQLIYWMHENKRLIKDYAGYTSISKRPESAGGVVHFESWRRAFGRLARSSRDYDEMIRSFWNLRLDLIAGAGTANGEITLICVVKDDLNRIRQFVEYYKQIGVEHFVFLDDGSTDGTREYLCGLPGYVDVYCSDVGYTTTIRQAWINRFIDLYGFQRWYLVVDSDEFLTYRDCENQKITKLLSYMQAVQIKRGRFFMLDMYSDSKIYSQNDRDLFLTYPFADFNGYEITDRARFPLLIGGARKRVYYSGRPSGLCLTKVPLLYAQEGDVCCNSHFLFPYRLNYEDCLSLGFLRHYKFTGPDLVRYKKRAEAGNFYNGSEEYLMYLSLSDAVFFDTDNSARFVDSRAIDSIALPEEVAIARYTL